MGKVIQMKSDVDRLFEEVKAMQPYWDEIMPCGHKRDSYEKVRGEPTCMECGAKLIAV